MFTESVKFSSVQFSSVEKASERFSHLHVYGASGALSISLCRDPENAATLVLPPRAPTTVELVLQLLGSANCSRLIQIPVTQKKKYYILY